MVYAPWRSLNQLTQQLIELGLSAHVDKITKFSKPCFYLEESPGRPSVDCLSWFGGNPRLPGGVAWPRAASGRHLDFLACIDLESLPRGDSSPRLPTFGRLIFFYDTVDEPPGDQHCDQLGSCTLWLAGHPEGHCTTPVDSSEFEETCVQAFAGISPPDDVSLWPGFDEAMMYLDRILAPGVVAHRLLGHPGSLQNGMPDSAAEIGARVYRLSRRHRWIMLLQLDSGGTPGWQWGSGGRIFWWINEDDLIEGRFDRTVTILQQT